MLVHLAEYCQRVPPFFSADGPCEANHRPCETVTCPMSPTELGFETPAWRSVLAFPNYRFPTPHIKEFLSFFSKAAIVCTLTYLGISPLVYTSVQTCIG